MVSKKLKISELDSVLNRINESEANSGGQEDGQLKEASPTASPAVQKSLSRENLFSSSGTIGTQSMNLPLPVTGGEVRMILMDLDPNRTFVSRVNPRNQELMSLSDPEVMGIVESLKNDKQRDPVVARETERNGEVWHEIISGSTRRFACITNSMPLKAWVGNIPDIDILAISKSENRDRHDISQYEEALYLANLMDTIYQGKSLEFVAESESLGTKQNVSNHLMLARFPLDLAKMMITPHGIKLTHANNIVKLIEKSSFTLKQIVDVLKKDAPYSDVKVMKRKIESLLLPKENDVASQKEPIEFCSKDGKAYAKLIPHRTKPGQFKVDCFDVTASDLKKISAFFNSLKR